MLAFDPCIRWNLGSFQPILELELDAQDLSWHGENMSWRHRFKTPRMRLV